MNEKAHRGGYNAFWSAMMKLYFFLYFLKVDQCFEISEKLTRCFEISEKLTRCFEISEKLTPDVLRFLNMSESEIISQYMI